MQVSTDGGKTWSTTLRHVDVRQIALGNTRDRLDAYVAASAGCASGRKEKAWVTHDGGRTWHVLGTNLASLAVHPRDPRLVYGASCAGIVETKDGGKTWTLLPGSTKPDYDPALVAIAASAPGTVYAAYVSEGGTIALRRTTDGGKTWTDLDDHGGDMVGPEDLVVEPRDPDTVHLITDGRSYLTRDAGRSWEAEEY